MGATARSPPELETSVNCSMWDLSWILGRMERKPWEGFDTRSEGIRFLCRVKAEHMETSKLGLHTLR